MQIEKHILCFGLVAIDIRVTENEHRLISRKLGGSCGNVCANLMAIRIPAVPVITLGQDSLGYMALSELEQMNISLRHVVLDESLGTPYFIEFFDDSSKSMRFRAAILDPYQKSPVFVAPPKNWIHRAFEIEKPKIVYLQKQSLDVYEACLEFSAKVFYEPDAIDDWEIHHQICEIADVIKYNHLNFVEYSSEAFTRCGGFIVETFGSEGLIIRNSDSIDMNGVYQTKSKLPVVDATGAGDWLSACLLSSLAKRNRITIDDIQFALKTSRVACTYAGARGFDAYRYSRYINDIDSVDVQVVRLTSDNIKEFIL